MGLSSEDELLLMLLEAVQRGDCAHGRQLAATAVATGLSPRVVEGIVALKTAPSAPLDDAERRLASELELPLIGEVDGSPAPLTSAAQRTLGIGFAGTLAAALGRVAGVAEDDPALLALLEQAHQTGRARATLGKGRSRYRVAAWTTPDGQLRAAAVPTGGDETREIETLATVNHEMANGVTALASLAALARHPNTSPEERIELLERIETTARHTLEAVKSTRRALRSHPPSELPPFDVAPLLRGLVASVEPAAGEAGVHLDARIGDDLHVRLRAADVRSIAWNLIKNAIEATPSGRAVHLSAQPHEDTLRLVVRDEGAGMDDETKRRAFDPFFTTKAEGSGLGLPLVKHLVERAGGELTLESRLGGGTRVVVSLPRAEALSGIQPISAVRPRAPLAGLRALVVGSDARSMAEGLRARGALLEDPQATVAAGAAIDVAVLSGVQGTMMIHALRPLAECLVWVGGGQPEDELVDARLSTPEVDALVELLRELYPDRLAV